MPRTIDEIRQEIFRLVGEYFDVAPPAVTPDKLPLVVAAYGKEEVCESIDALLSTYVTMGPRVARFEEAFAKRVGAAHAIMVNSGSSANLLALAVLANPAFPDRIRPGDEVIVPAVTWSTTVWPIAQVGAVPVLVDVSMDTLCMDPAEVERALSKKTRAIMPVHLLGNSCDMKALGAIAKKHNLFVVEDTCEALGAEFEGKVTGAIGDMGTYSFYFSHHMTTIEGGMVVTNDPVKAELTRILRAHGWTRNLANRDEIARRYPEIDSRFLFVNTGYNLRPTEIQGAFGVHQLGRLDGFNEVRRRNAAVWEKRLARYSGWIECTHEQKGAKHTWFAYPIIVRKEAPFTKKELVTHLESRGIETRPVVAGNLAKQPAFRYIEHRVVGDLPNSQKVMDRGFFFGNHGVMTPDDCNRVADAFEEFFARFGNPGGK